MAQVYRLRSIPAWDTNRTLLVFIVSSVVLGGLALEFFDTLAIRQLVVGIGLGVALRLSLSERNNAYKTASRLRLGLIVMGVIGVTAIFFVPNMIRMWLTIPIFLIVLSEEVIGRWLFYKHLHQRIL